MIRPASLIYPHQLFLQSPLEGKSAVVILVEELLFFRQYAFHKAKIAFHRASMRRYADLLRSRGRDVIYIGSDDRRADVRLLIAWLREEGFSHLFYIDPVDDWLERRMHSSAGRAGLELTRLTSPMLLNDEDELGSFFLPGKKKYLQAAFYIGQRKTRNILLNESGGPLHGQWSFDADNRKKYPKGQRPPEVKLAAADDYYREALAYVQGGFSGNPGELTDQPIYPTSHELAEKWLAQFLEERLELFGPYEDAIVQDEVFLHHSVLSPLLNVGLLTPRQVLDITLKHATDKQVPFNSLEGFIRQLTGWREFIAAIYRFRGREQRTRNFWGFSRKIPASFYNATTGIQPVDTVIKKVLRTGYCHHIERLMVLGNFMLLCEIDPDEVYRWFMELFIDAYDWVMVPNVYGMSQFADGGLLATKPYISGSNYLLKMSDFPKGDWQQTWDALFWRFMHVYRDFFSRNPRLGMLVKSFDKMPEERRAQLLETAENFLGEHLD